MTFLQGDFREEEVFEKLLNILNGRQVDVVISDMAPNTSGNRAVDQPRQIYLCELALDFAQNQNTEYDEPQYGILEVIAQGFIPISI